MSRSEDYKSPGAKVSHGTVSDDSLRLGPNSYQLKLRSCLEECSMANETGGSTETLPRSKSSKRRLRFCGSIRKHCIMGYFVGMWSPRNLLKSPHKTIALGNSRTSPRLSCSIGSKLIRGQCQDSGLKDPPPLAVQMRENIKGAC